MKEITFSNPRDIFHHGADAVCVTTNGFNRRDGKAVMGRGIAAYVAKRDPIVQSRLGDANRKDWRQPVVLRQYGTKLAIVSFPVKPAIGRPCDVLPRLKTSLRSNTIPGWACKARLDIIVDSARRLVKLADEHGWNMIMIPAPGCGNGGLSYSDVKPVLEPILDDRFYISFLKR